MPEVSKVIIYQHNDYLLQLRDHTPDIVYAGYWSFLGGAIEAREAAWQGLQPELSEKLEWQLDAGAYLYDWVNPEHLCRIHFFMVPFTEIGPRSYSMSVKTSLGLTWMRLHTIHEWRLLSYNT